jgi:hypothetical protein
MGTFESRITRPRPPRLIFLAEFKRARPPASSLGSPLGFQPEIAEWVAYPHLEQNRPNHQNRGH